MKKIFTTKISLQSSNPTFSYPIIRLPRELKELAGRIATIYQTQIDGVEGFFIALQLDKLDKYVENKKCIDTPILASACQKPSPEVLQPQLSATTTSDPTIVHEPLPDTPIGARPGGPKRVRGRHRLTTQDT
jgi:hypothetical protein